MRSDHEYADFRRPHRVEFSDSIELDLARRDFTVNAIAWGAEAGGTPSLVDPHGGGEDLAAGTLRAVGDPVDSVRRGRPADASGSPPGGDAGLHDRAGDAGGDPRSSRARPTPLRRTHRRPRCDSCSPRTRRRPASGCSPTPGSSNTSPPSSLRNGACRRTRSPARTCGTTRSARSTARDKRPAPPPSGGPAARHRQAIDDGGRSVRRSRARRGRPGAGPPRPLALARGRARAGRPSDPPPHVRVRPPTGPTPPSAGSSSRSVRTALDELFLLREADNRGLGPASGGGASAGAAFACRGPARLWRCAGVARVWRSTGRT